MPRIPDNLDGAVLVNLDAIWENEDHVSVTQLDAVDLEGVPFLDVTYLPLSQRIVDHLEVVAALKLSADANVRWGIAIPIDPARSYNPLTLPMRTTGGTCIIDPSAYPGLVDLVVAHADEKTRLALWGTHPALQEHLNSHYYAHAVRVCYGFAALTGPLPLAFRDDPFLDDLEEVGNLARHCRILDLEGECNLSKMSIVLGMSGIHTLRTYNTTDISKINIPRTVVLKCNCVPDEPIHWECRFDLNISGTVPPTERLVYNVAYSWADSLFASTMGPKTLPDSVKELVVHLKYIPQERARYFVCKPNGSGSHERISAHGTARPVPQLAEDEHLDLVYFPTTEGGTLFNDIANLYRPGLKLTLVGLDEFDTARNADEAGDADWAAMYATLPWDGPVPPLPTRSAYHSIADTFVEDLVQTLHWTKRAQARREVQVLTSAEYLKLGPREEEDWWPTD